MENNPYIETLEKLFFAKVEKSDNSDWQPKRDGKPYYWRFFCTTDICGVLNIKPDKARRDLTKLEKQGVVEADRQPNNIRWALVNYPGFKKHIFYDYAERI